MPRKRFALSELKDEMQSMMLYASLTPTSQSALRVADFFFEKSKTNEFCFIDAGPISLNYFRIIELELNNRLIQPLVEMITVEEIMKTYFYDVEAFIDEKSRESFKNKWSRLQQDLKRIKEKKQHGITLGSLAIYLRQLAQFRQKGSSFVNYLWSRLEQIMTDEGCTAIQNGEIAAMINQDVLEKYRNPPAHTRYLSYKVACECKQYVTEGILKMHTWFKDKDTSVQGKDSQ